MSPPMKSIKYKKIFKNKNDVRIQWVVFELCLTNLTSGLYLGDPTCDHGDYFL